MFMIPEQLSAATKTNIEAQVALLSNLTSKYFEGVEQVVGLNLAVAKKSLEDSGETAKQLFAAKDAQELLAKLHIDRDPGVLDPQRRKHLLLCMHTFIQYRRSLTVK